MCYFLTLSVPWLLMKWWCKEPVHQQPCYCPSLVGIFRLQHHKGQVGPYQASSDCVNGVCMAATCHNVYTGETWLTQCYQEYGMWGRGEGHELCQGWNVHSCFISPLIVTRHQTGHFIPQPNEVVGGFTLFVCRSICPSVHLQMNGFLSISQVCFGILIWNFMWMLIVAKGHIGIFWSGLLLLCDFEYQVQISVAHYFCVVES